MHSLNDADVEAAPPSHRSMLEMIVEALEDQREDAATNEVGELENTIEEDNNGRRLRGAGGQD